MKAVLNCSGEWFSPLIEEAISDINKSTGAGLADDKARHQIREIMEARIGIATHDFFLHELAKLCLESNPLLEFDASLITEDEVKAAAPILLERLEKKEILLPERMERSVGVIIKNLTAYIKEFLCDLDSHKDEISSAVLDGRKYSGITGIVKAGDAHNHGRFTAIVETDAGKIVYKPHSCRIDQAAYDLMKEYFSYIILMPKVFACEDRFGVAQFLEKKRAEGRDSAGRYYYALGGTAAVLLMMGSKDMHMENLFACGERIAIIDLETLIYPYPGVIPDPGVMIFSKEDQKALYDTLMNSSLVNTRMKLKRQEEEFSILMNTGEDGSAPVVDGEKQSVLPFERDFYEGFSDIYDRVLELRPVLKDKVAGLFSGRVIRTVLTATKVYSDILKRLNSNYSYSSEDYYKSQWDKLPGVLSRNKIDYCRPAEETEVAALIENDIPFFYTFSLSRDLYFEGKIVEKDYFMQSGLERTLEILDHMSREEKEFEMRFLRFSLAGAKVAEDLSFYPVKGLKGEELPKEDEPVLGPKEAVLEAERVFHLIMGQALTLHTGTGFWLSFSPSEDNPSAMGVGLYSGIAGMAVFFAAMEKGAADPEVGRKAADALDSCLRLLGRYGDSILNSERVFDEQEFSLGEGEGLAGVLRSLVIINRFRNGCCRQLIDNICRFLKKIDVSAYKETDKVSGLSGLIVTLCRYEELYTYDGIKDVIRALCDRLKSLKTLEWEETFVWKTMSDKNHPISGAVHGMAGIAEAFFLADLRLGRSDYMEPALAALSFEDRVYSEDLGGWEDRRVPGVHVLAKGNCYGAPGMGIIFNRLKNEGIKDVMLDRNEMRAYDTVVSSRLLLRDHLCCGNMSTVEYFLETGRVEDAGRLLYRLVNSAGSRGAYALGYENSRTNDNVTLFYGLAGIGYELLRYADPKGVPTVL